MLRSRMQSRQGAVLTDQNEEPGTRHSRKKQRESRLPFINQRNCGKSIGKKRKPSCTSTSWLTFEENFTTFVETLVLVTAWRQTDTRPRRSWQENCWTKDRLVLFFQAVLLPASARPCICLAP